jgi:uncharacterized membrane protein YkoI
MSTNKRFNLKFFSLVFLLYLVIVIIPLIATLRVVKADSGDSTDSSSSLREAQNESEAKQTALEQEAQNEASAKKAEADKLQQEAQQKAQAAQAADASQKTKANQVAQAATQAVTRANAQTTEAQMVLSAVQTMKTAISTDSAKSIIISPNGSIGNINLTDNNGTTNKIVLKLTDKTGLTSYATNYGVVTFYLDPSTGEVNIGNNNVLAASPLPISINPANKSISVVTNSDITNPVTTGIIYPIQAAQVAASKTNLQGIGIANLAVNNNNQVIYNMDGVQKVHLFGFLPAIQASTTVQVNAQNGTVLSTSQPWYLNVFGWLFKKDSSTLQGASTVQNI